jgi:replicative DNA helicase
MKQPYKKEIPQQNAIDVAGKLPPQVIEFEEAVLGAIILEPNCIGDVFSILTSSDFYKEAHSLIFDAIEQISATLEPVDLLTVTHQLRTNGKLEFVGGASYLVKITGKVNSSANVEYHSRIIKQSSIKRKFIQIAGNILKEAYDDTTDVFDFKSRVESEFFDISFSIEQSSRKNLILQLNDTFDSLRNATKGIFTGIRSKFRRINDLIISYENDNLYLIAARPAMGKSALMMNEVEDMVNRGYYVKVFSMEMSAKQQLQRLLALKAMVNYTHIRSGQLTTDDWRSLDEAREKISLYDGRLEIIEDSNVSVSKIATYCRQAKLQGKCDIVFIDYLGLMSFSKETSNKSTADQVGAISRGLKNLARELHIPFVALCQLSRAAETRGGDKRPQLSDLRDSGSLEQDADSVFFLYRPEYYKITQYSDGSPTAGVCEIIVAKNRAGDTATMEKDIPKLSFLGQYQKMTEEIPNIISTSNSISDFEKNVTFKLDDKLKDEFPF